MTKVQVSEELAVVVEYLKSVKYDNEYILLKAREKSWNNNNFFGYNVEILNNTESTILNEVINNNYEIENSTIRGVGNTVKYEVQIGDNEDIKLGKTMSYKDNVVEIINILAVKKTKEQTIAVIIGRVL